MGGTAFCSSVGVKVRFLVEDAPIEPNADRRSLFPPWDDGKGVMASVCLQTVREKLTQRAMRLAVAVAVVAPFGSIMAAADDAVGVLLTGPRVAAVGESVSFEVELVNRSGQSLSQLRVIDYFDKGLQHPASASPIEQKGTIDLAAGTSRRLTLEFQIVEAGRQCHRVEILDQANQAVGGATACVEAVPPNSPAATAAGQGNAVQGADAAGRQPPAGPVTAGSQSSAAPQATPAGPPANGRYQPPAAVGGPAGPDVAAPPVVEGGLRGVGGPTANGSYPGSSQIPSQLRPDATVSGGTADASVLAPTPGRGTPNVASLSAAPQLSAAFEISISGPETVAAGEVAEFVLVVKNIGVTAADQASLEVNWDVPLTPLEASDGYTLGRGNATWSIPAIAAGDEVRRQINFRGVSAVGSFIDSPGTRACVRTVLSGLPGGNMVADEACLVIHSQAVRPQSLQEAGLRISLADLDDPVRLGSGTTLVCTIVNDGDRPSGTLDLLIELPDQARLVGNPIPSRVRIDGNRIAFDGIASLPAGGRSSFELVYRMPAGEQGQATATVSGKDLDGVLEASCRTTFLKP
jgi:hypothetical protein